MSAKTAKRKAAAAAAAAARAAPDHDADGGDGGGDGEHAHAHGHGHGAPMRPVQSIDQLSLGDSVADLLVRVISPAVAVGPKANAKAKVTGAKQTSAAKAARKRKSASPDADADDDADSGAAAAGALQPALISRVEDRSGFCILSVVNAKAKGNAKTKGKVVGGGFEQLLQPEKKLKVTGSVAVGPSGVLEIRVDAGPNGNGGHIEATTDAEWKRACGASEAHPPVASATAIAVNKQLYAEQQQQGKAAGGAAASGALKCYASGGDFDVSGVTRMYGSILVRKKPLQSFLEFLLVTDVDTGEWRFPAEVPLPYSAETERECAYRSVPLDEFTLLQTPPVVEYTRRFRKQSQSTAAAATNAPAANAKANGKAGAKADVKGADDAKAGAKPAAAAAAAAAAENAGAEADADRNPYAADPKSADGMVQTHYYVALLNAEYDLQGDETTQWCSVWSGPKFLYADQMHTLRAAHALVEARARLGLLFSADPVPLALNPDTSLFTSTAAAGDAVPSPSPGAVSAVSAAGDAANSNSKREGAAILMQTPLPESKKLPVTILSGFLGSGKTTLLTRILHNTSNMRVAVIVNDMAEVNIDAKLVTTNAQANANANANGNAHNPNGSGGGMQKMVELSNGCICCTLREDLLAQIVELARSQRYDYLLIESSGISEPQQIAEVFEFTDAAGHSLSDFARLDTTVTVLDAFHFFADLLSADAMNSAESRLAALTKVQTDKHTKLTAEQKRTGNTLQRRLDAAKVAPAASASAFAPANANANGKAGSGKRSKTPADSDAARAVKALLVDALQSDAKGAGAADPDCPDGTCPDVMTPEQRAKAAADAEQHKPLAELLVDQIEFADVIVINKCDLLLTGTGAGASAGVGTSDAKANGAAGVVLNAELKRIESCMKLLNRTAQVLYVSHGAVEPKNILNTRRFDLERARESAGWLSELRGTHKPETAEYGITSFVYRQKKPFHPQRLYDLLTADPAHIISSTTPTQDASTAAAAAAGSSKPHTHAHAHPNGHGHSHAHTHVPRAATAAAVAAGTGTHRGVFGAVLRSKGFFWLATNMTHFGAWAQAGRVFSFGVGGLWWAVTPEEAWPHGDADFAQHVLPRMDKRWGDRSQELVFIGGAGSSASASGPDRSWQTALRAALDVCLLTDAEMRLDPERVWQKWSDPFERCGWSAANDRKQLADMEAAAADDDEDEDDDDDDDEDDDVDGGEDDDGDGDGDGDGDAEAEGEDDDVDDADADRGDSDTKRDTAAGGRIGGSRISGGAKVPAFIAAARERRKDGTAAARTAAAPNSKGKYAAPAPMSYASKAKSKRR